MAPYSQPHICCLAGQILRLDVRMGGGGSVRVWCPPVCVQRKGKGRGLASGPVSCKEA